MTRTQRSPLTQAQVESLLLDLTDALQDATDEYDTLCSSCAEAEMDYKHAKHAAIVDLAGSTTRMTSDVRAAQAWLRSEQLERAYQVLAAAKEAGREHLRTLTTRIEALRTISANVRGQT